MTDDRYAPKICKNCGKEFTPTKGHPNKIYCCNDCYLEHRKKTSYMQRYYQDNTERWKARASTQDFKDHKNLLRRQRYATDAEYREKIKQKGIKYNQRHPTAKLSQRLRKFGLTIEDYNRILDFQHGKCAICGCEIGDVMGNRLYVDHDHATGSVRGLLCSSCNFGLGNFHDDPQLLHNAIQYLEEGCI